ncbi:MAG: hypothetical protein EOO61_04105, partial [Hymenobacter sp.]
MFTPVLKLEFYLPPRISRTWLAGLFTLLCLALTPGLSLAQQGTATFHDPSIEDPGYDARKRALVVKQNQNARISSQLTGTNKAAGARAFAVIRPACFESFDTTASGGWTSLGRNDDGSTGAIPLGFNFSLFGTVYNTVYVNNNGNITFNAALSEFSASGFPMATPMVAGFWADVDTRNTTSGTVWYKKFADRFVVTYNHVGYYSSMADKTNTFQITIKANTAAGFTGNDVILAYEDMQWSTGSASQGVSGFGGVPATVGVNRGNGVDFLQVGRFNQAGSTPPNSVSAGSPGGVDFLDGQCIGYRVGPAGNVPPAVAGLPNNNSFTINQGETRTVNLQFSGPETNQTVNVTSSLNGLCNATATTTSNNTSNPTTTFQITGSSCNVGTHDVTFTALDNGSPAASQTFTIQVTVRSPITATLSNNGPLSCTQTSALLTASGGSTYRFSTGATQINGGSTATVTTSGVYSVTVTSADGATAVAQTTVTGDQIAPTASLINSGPLSCTQTSALLTASGGSSYRFSTGAIQINDGNTASVTTAGTYSVTVTAANGCTATASTTVSTNQQAPVATLTSDGPLTCNKTSVLLTASGGGGYRFSIGATQISNGNTATVSGSGVYSVTVTATNGCTATNSITVTQSAALVASVGSQTNVSSNGASNGRATVSITGGVSPYSYSWSPSGGTGVTATGLSAGVYTVTVRDANTCQTTQSFTITQPAVLVAGVGSQTNVSGNGGSNGAATVSVTGGVGPYTYSWSPSGGTAATASGLSAGTYTVTVTDANGNTTTRVFTITQPPVLVAGGGSSQTN